MTRDRWVLSVSMFALGCLVLFAPSAGAKPKHQPKPAPKTKLLPGRFCKGLLTLGDFPGAVFEGGVKSQSSTLFSSECTFIPPESTESDPEPKGLGFDTLSVDTSPRSYEPKGKPLNLLAGVDSPKNSPTETVIPIHGFGTRAEIVLTNESAGGIGVMQVRNDLFTVHTETVSQVKPLLSKVAHELSPTGK